MVEPTWKRVWYVLIAGSALVLWVGLADMGQAHSPLDRPPYALPAWDQTFPAEARFVVLVNFSDEAVLDQNTGLVWERSPKKASAEWKAAMSACLNRPIGGQRGWRVPSIVELTSLLDPSNLDSSSMLPSGHPFLGSPSGFYWSASSDGDPLKAWHLHLSNGHVHMTSKTSTFQVWCVRGASTGDQQ